MKTINALAYIRQLCCSRLPRDIVLLELLSAVQTVIPSCNNFFVGYDAELFPIYTVQDYSFGKLTEHVPELILPYYSDANRSRWQKLFKSQAKIEITIMVDNFYKSDIYNAFYRPFEQHHIIGAPAYHNGQVVGALELCRPRQQKPFSDSDHALLLRIMPYVSHALRLPKEAETLYSPNGNTGMMIMDRLGNLLFQDETAKHLLTLANSGLFPFPSGAKEFDVMPQLGKLCRNLNAIFQGKEVAPPYLSHHNGYGKFIW